MVFRREELDQLRLSAKRIRFGVPTSIDLEIWKSLDPQNNRLTRLRLEKARKRHRNEVEAETRKIHFDNRGNYNGMAVPYALLRMKLKKADEFAEWQYSILRDVWLRLGGVESAAFIRTISWMVIQRPFDALGDSFAHEEARRFLRSGGLHPRVSPETIRKGFDELKTEWRDKLETMAMEWEADVQGKAVTVPMHNSIGETTPRTHEGPLGTRCGFVHSEDYRSIKFKGTDYVLTPNQSLVVQILHEALKQDLPGVSHATLLARLGSSTSRLRDSFKSGDGPRLWKAFIVKIRRTKDMYKLNLS